MDEACGGYIGIAGFIDSYSDKDCRTGFKYGLVYIIFVPKIGIQCLTKIYLNLLHVPIQRLHETYVEP